MPLHHMYHSFFRSPKKLPKKLRLDGNRLTSMESTSAAEVSLDSATALLNRSPESEDTKTPWYESSGALSQYCVVLHVTLVLIHILLLVVWACHHLEHNLVFALEYQNTVSLVITGITTTFITIYSSVLVYMTQTLATRRNLQAHHTLTATHDITAAWSGIGSAVTPLWKQKTVLASVPGVLSVLLYLGNIMALHITTPALFSLQTFNSSQLITVQTQGLPNINNTEIENMLNYTQLVTGLFPFIGNVTTIGLYDGSLYDVFNPTLGSGNVSVNATGFNITCGYAPSNVTLHTEYQGTPYWEIQFGSKTIYITLDVPLILALGDLGIVQPFWQPIDGDNSIYIISTIPIVDSNNSYGNLLNLTYTVQVLQCSQSLVNQHAIVDTQSRELLAVNPRIRKTSSMWLPYQSSGQNLRTGNNLLDNASGQICFTILSIDMF
ncbi:hypothetical protein B0H10DRAFT_1953592 [Mycena sp. CBHHK59/15]|nr:hypothetical protein B0H10DRAFT_1953592 [Mycena sp. CBHHK59/15]